MFSTSSLSRLVWENKKDTNNQNAQTKAVVQKNSAMNTTNADNAASVLENASHTISSNAF